MDKSKGLEVYADADFSGGWSAADSENADNVLSRTGFVICYVNCPILIWCSKLQTEIALSAAEAEYIACLTHCVRPFQFRISSKRSVVYFTCQL